MNILEIQKKGTEGFVWLDLCAPNTEELEMVAEHYQLHPMLIKDILQSDHLPKYEKTDAYSFILFRVFDAKNVKNTNTIQQFTTKVSLFFSKDFVISIHKNQQSMINSLAEEGEEKAFKTPMILINKIIMRCLNTYQQPLTDLSEEIDHYESIIFLNPHKVPLLKGLYHLKRRIDLITRMIELSSEIIEVVDTKRHQSHTRETRDIYIKLKSQSSYLSESTMHLLSIYFSATSQRTNEIMRVLTIFSVFFMPLSFIVGLYGMNFDNMPELSWHYGYPLVIFLMAAVVLVIYFWFKRKKWL